MNISVKDNDWIPSNDREAFILADDIFYRIDMDDELMLKMGYAMKKYFSEKMTHQELLNAETESHKENRAYTCGKQTILATRHIEK